MRRRLQEFMIKPDRIPANAWPINRIFHADPNKYSVYGIRQPGFFFDDLHRGQTSLMTNKRPIGSFLSLGFQQVNLKICLLTTRRKKRLPKSSSRHPPSFGARGHYSTSPSFWQTPVRCPGDARFNSGYSRCVSSLGLWISFILSTCSWTRILRSFLNLDIRLRTHGIRQPLVRCLPCPGYTEKLDFLRDDFSQCFLRAPGIWCLPRLRHTRKLEFSR